MIISIVGLNVILLLQSSGVKVNSQCTVEFEKLKMKKEYRYIIFKLSDNMKEIIVDETSPRGKLSRFSVAC